MIRRKVLALLLPVLVSAACGKPSSPPFCQLNALPNPVARCPPKPVVTHLGWFCEGTPELVQIRVGSAQGDLLAEGGPYGDSWTGDWLDDGIDFFLVRKSDGITLAKVRVEIDDAPCP